MGWGRISSGELSSSHQSSSSRYPGQSHSKVKVSTKSSLSIKSAIVSSDSNSEVLDFKEKPLPSSLSIIIYSSTLLPKRQLYVKKVLKNYYYYYCRVLGLNRNRFHYQ